MTPERQRRATYLTISGLFFTLFTTFSTTRLRRAEVGVRPFDFVLLVLATFRLGRLLAFDTVAQPLREPFTETKPDPTGAGDTVEPEGTGARRALGELLSCPICAGTWVSAGLVYGLHLLPGPTRALLAIMGAIGCAEILNAATESMSWSGQVARKKAGEG